MGEKVTQKLIESPSQSADALVAYREGIAVAEARGDKQAAKEMALYDRHFETLTHENRSGSHENG